MSDTRDPHTDQVAPVHNDGPSMHDLVIRDLSSRDLRWDLSIGRARRIRDEVCEDLAERKAFGLAKYGTVLQSGNGRDMLRDLYDELLDAAVYARGAMAESPTDGLEWPVLAEVYESVVTGLVKVRRLRDAQRNERPSLPDASYPIASEEEIELAKVRARMAEVRDRLEGTLNEARERGHDI